MWIRRGVQQQPVSNYIEVMQVFGAGIYSSIRIEMIHDCEHFHPSSSDVAEFILESEQRKECNMLDLQWCIVWFIPI